MPPKDVKLQAEEEQSKDQEEEKENKDKNDVLILNPHENASEGAFESPSVTAAINRDSFENIDANDGSSSARNERSHMEENTPNDVNLQASKDQNRSLFGPESTFLTKPIDYNRTLFGNIERNSLFSNRNRSDPPSVFTISNDVYNLFENRADSGKIFGPDGDGANLVGNLGDYADYIENSDRNYILGVIDFKQK